MEISEYLTRINLKGADNTLFKREEKEVKIVRDGKESIEKVLGINSYTFFENGTAAVSGFIRYDKEFPEQVFAINPEILQRVLELSERIEIVDSFLIGRSKSGDVSRDLEFMKWRKAQAKYDNPSVSIKNNVIQNILAKDLVIDSSYVTFMGDGETLVLTLHPKIGQGEGKILIPSEIKTECRFDSSMLMQVLKLVGSSDVRLFLDIVSPEGRKKSPMRLDVADKNAQISYFVTEAAVEMSQVASDETPKERKKKPKEEKVETGTKSEQTEEEKESDEILNLE